MHTKKIALIVALLGLACLSGCMATTALERKLDAMHERPAPLPAGEPAREWSPDALSLLKVGYLATVYIDVVTAPFQAAYILWTDFAAKSQPAPAVED